MNNDQEKELNFEVNLLPVISLLAVLISFLLLTAVWINIGTMDVDQALGNETQNGKENPPTIWAKFESRGEVRIMLKDIDGVPSRLREVNFLADRNEPQWERISSYVAQIKESYPQIETALILPGKLTSYEQMIKMMDGLKGTGLKNIGIAPL